ncbi:unnamed protein product [Ambrosiozyma monospora]|uniref:Unnamed protein product n=1 Tax=Ambrosiozyma monospora TaxID=43982 RepID=A0ACB5TUV2_AMBMO|nr:unnamed protein product [Ambrosiozyma monospora]
MSEYSNSGRITMEIIEGYDLDKSYGDTTDTSFQSSATQPTTSTQKSAAQHQETQKKLSSPYIGKQTGERSASVSSELSKHPSMRPIPKNNHNQHRQSNGSLKRSKTKKVFGGFSSLLNRSRSKSVSASMISDPIGFQTVRSVKYDQDTQKYLNLPPEWARLLDSQGISTEEQSKNPEAANQVMMFYNKNYNDEGNKYMQLQDS